MATAAHGQQMDLGPEIQGTATYYHPMYNGGTTSCGQTYWASDPTAAAVGPARYDEWPCGTQLLITGPSGSTVVTRQDKCPGCSATKIDLSERGSTLVCGRPTTCSVTIQEIR